MPLHQNGDFSTHDVVSKSRRLASAAKGLTAGLPESRTAIYVIVKSVFNSENSGGGRGDRAKIVRLRNDHQAMDAKNSAELSDAARPHPFQIYLEQIILFRVARETALPPRTAKR